MKSRTNWPAVALLVVVAGLIGHTTSGNRQAPPEPAIVATVDLEGVFRQLDERTAADGQLVQMAGELDADGQRKRDEIELLRQDLELYAPGSKQYQDVSQEIAKKGFQLQAFLDFAMRKLDAEKSETLNRIYDGIKDAIRQLAEEHQYDVVFVDDSVVGLPPDTSEAEMMRQISARRMLYTNAQIDITQRVVDRMNARFVAGENP